MDFTLVLGVDRNHLEQFHLSTATWKKHKPSLFERPWVVFLDAQDDIKWSEIKDSLPKEVHLEDWPQDGIVYQGDPNDKWTNPQRYKMLAGFVHVPAATVSTKYWLKLDLDTVATGFDDWIDVSWFEMEPAIVAQKWHYTKPPNQMVVLEKWADKETPLMHFPLSQNIVPNEGWSLLKHKRIISWCGFFSADFTRYCSKIAQESCGGGKLPVPSQDGFMWYTAARMGLPILREQMKSRGWEHWSSTKNVRAAAKRSLEI